MAVIGLAAERPGSPRASFSVGKFTITRKYLVRTSSVNDGPGTVVLAIGLPRLFQPYVFGSEFLPFCRCRSVDPERMAPGSLDWEVTCVYETPEPKGGARGDGANHDGTDGDGGGTGQETDGQFDNPLLALPEIETHYESHKIPIYGVQGLGVNVTVTNGSPDVTVGNATFFSVGDSVTVTKGSSTLTTTISSITPGPPAVLVLAANWTGTSGTALIVDNNFKPCQASNGEIFVPAPEMDESHLILTITRNEDINSPHPALAITYQDTVNSDVFWNAVPGTCKCRSITVQRQVKNYPDGSVFPYLRVTYIFHFKSTWDIQLLDKGTWYWYQQSGATPKRKQKFLSDDGQPIDGLLDGQGGKLATGAAPVFLTVRPYARLPFSALNLPQTFQTVQ
jgi:hypothetical protein